MSSNLAKENDVISSAFEDVETVDLYSDSVVSLLEKCLNRDDENRTPLANSIADGSFSLPRDPIGIRGRANFSESEEDEDEDEESSSDTDKSSSSSSKSVIKSNSKDIGIPSDQTSSSSLKEIQEGTSKINNRNGQQPSKSIPKQHEQKKKKNSKKRTKEDLMKQMGSAPNSIVILGQDPRVESSNTSSNDLLALKVPTVLMPKHQITTDTNNPYEKQPPSPIESLYNLSASMAKSHTSNSKNNLTLVILLQSGRFAAAIFHRGKCLKHTTSVRYTTRKGQGGAQSSNDNAKGKAKSIGSQLRRAGEVQLRKDVMKTLTDWYDEIKHSVGFCFLSVSKMLQKGFWEDAESIFSDNDGNNSCSLKKGSEMVKSIPLDAGRPSYEACYAVYDLMMSLKLVKINREIFTNTEEPGGSGVASNGAEPCRKTNNKLVTNDLVSNKAVTEKEIPKRVLNIPLTPFHEAARDGKVQDLLNLLSSENDSIMEQFQPNVNVRAGPKLMTPLHYAAASSSNIDPADAQKCISLLLIQGSANPCILDSHDRPPYYVCTNDNLRNTFRKARAQIGEDAWDWDGDAKVGPPLTEDALQRKKEKAAEKKRRQRQRQKERKAEAQEKERLAQEEADKKKKEEDAKRARAGLQPKKAAGAGDIVCDYCQKICKGKRKSQLFSRLAYIYCSTDCVQKHKRELMAAAASARFSTTL